MRWFSSKNTQKIGQHFAEILQLESVRNQLKKDGVAEYPYLSAWQRAWASLSWSLFSIWYSEGAKVFDENHDPLNHNLLTITDPKGHTYLINEYHTTTDPNNFNYDRVTRQTWGDPGDIIDFTYVRLEASSDDNAPTTKTISVRAVIVSGSTRLMCVPRSA